MSLLITDLDLAKQLIAEREATDGAAHDEVWDEVYVMSPLPNNEHLKLSAELWLVFRTVLGETGSGTAFKGLNVSDRENGWEKNYRESDVAVILNENPAKDCDTHWCGGPDLVVEILSPGDRASDKRGFYASVGVKELLIIDRKPWQLELFRLTDESLDLVGRSTPDGGESLVSRRSPSVSGLSPAKHGR